MHTVELLEQALETLKHLGYVVRQEWLSGNGGGPCQIRGRKVFFLDLSVSHAEQLGQVAGAIRGEPFAAHAPMPAALRKLLGLRDAA